MEISSDKSKILVNSIIPRPSTTKHIDEWKTAGRSGPVQILRIHTNQRWNINKGSKDQTGTSTVSHDKTKSNTLGKNSVISFPIMIKLYKSVVLSTLLYGCQNWMLTADLERRIRTSENRCYRRMPGISYREHKTNEYVRQQANILAGRQELLL